MEWLNQTIADFRELADYESLDLPDGSTLRVEMLPDTDTSILDGDAGDWFGALTWDDGRTNAYGYRERPDGFNGRARILERDRDARLWWQPPADVSDADLPALASHVSEILTYGYRVLALHWHLPGGGVRSTYLGGIEPFADSNYVADCLSDMAADL